MDWTDRLLERWATLRPDFGMEPYQVTARIGRIAQHVARHQEEIFAAFDLNRGEVGVLSALRTSGPPNRLSPTRLFKGLMLSSAGMTSRLDRLEERGFVRRSPDPADRRGVLVELTDTGLNVLEEAVAASTASEGKLLESLSDAEQADLGKLLKKLLSGLEPIAADTTGLSGDDQS